MTSGELAAARKDAAEAATNGEPSTSAVTDSAQYTTALETVAEAACSLVREPVGDLRLNLWARLVAALDALDALRAGGEEAGA